MDRTNTTKRNERQQNSGKADKNPLTDRQRKAIPFIVTSATYTEGCKRAKVDRKTFYAWLKDPAFKAELDRQRDEVAAEAFGILTQSLTKAVETLTGLLDSQDERLKRLAFKDVIEHILKYREAKDLEERLAAIEQRLQERR